MSTMSTRQLEEKRLIRDMVEAAIQNKDRTDEILGRVLSNLNSSIERDTKFPFHPVS